MESLTELTTEIEELVNIIGESDDLLGNEAVSEFSQNRLRILREALQHMIVNKIAFAVTTYPTSAQQRENFIRVLSAIAMGSCERSGALSEALGATMAITNATMITNATISAIVNSTADATRQKEGKPQEESQEKELDLSFVKLANDHYSEMRVMEEGL